MADRTNPFDNLEEWIDRLNRQFDTRSQLDLSMSGSTTQLDLADQGDEFVVTVDVPGYETDDLEIKLRGDTLAISGEREHKQAFENGDEDEMGGSEATYIRREREMQSFTRQIQIPEPVDSGEVTATVNNGILTVHLPKRDQSGDAHTIDID